MIIYILYVTLTIKFNISLKHVDWYGIEKQDIPGYGV